MRNVLWPLFNWRLIHLGFFYRNFCGVKREKLVGKIWFIWGTLFLSAWKCWYFLIALYLNCEIFNCTRGGRSHFFRLGLRSCSKVFESGFGSGNFSNLRIRLLFRLRLPSMEPGIHTCFTYEMTTQQARNQGRRRGAKTPLEKFSPPLEKCVGHNLKLLDTVQKIWAPLRKLFAPPGIPSWLRACHTDSCYCRNWTVTPGPRHFFTKNKQKKEKPSILPESTPAFRVHGQLWTVLTIGYVLKDACEYKPNFRTIGAVVYPQKFCSCKHMSSKAGQNDIPFSRSHLQFLKFVTIRATILIFDCLSVSLHQTIGLYDRCMNTCFSCESSADSIGASKIHYFLPLNYASRAIVHCCC